MAEEAERPKINELARWSLFAKAPGTEGRNSRLAWAVRDNCPRITVYTNIPTDTTNYGIIYAGMNPETFFVFLERFEEIIRRGENGDKNGIPCYTTMRDNEGGRGEKTELSRLMFGKDENGIVWISVIAQNRPKVKFEFRIYEYHKILKGDGTEYSESETSKFQALALIRAFWEIFPPLTAGFRQPAAGGANRGNRSNSNYQDRNKNNDGDKGDKGKPLTELNFDDDISF